MEWKQANERVMGGDGDGDEGRKSKFAGEKKDEFIPTYSTGGFKVHALVDYPALICRRTLRSHSYTYVHSLCIYNIGGAKHMMPAVEINTI